MRATSSISKLVDMPQAMTVFVADKGAAPDPVVAVDPVQVKEWSAETDILPGAVAISARGRSMVAIGDPDGEELALALYDRTRAAGYPARIKVAGAAGGYTYQVVLGGLVSRDVAAQAAAALSARLEVPVRVIR